MNKVRKMLEQLYNRHSAGCCLHIVTDDGNIRDRDVEFCIEYAKKENCRFCLEFAVALQEIGELGRAHLLDMKICSVHGYSLYQTCGMSTGAGSSCGQICSALPPLEAA